MKNKKFIVTLNVFLTAFGLGQVFIPPVQAQEKKLESKDVEFKAQKFRKDNLGTKVENIHTFEVKYKEKERKDENSYVVVFCLDDNEVQQFNNVRLPFSFDWNFRGMRPGSRAVKIKIEDNEGNLLATQESTVYVVP